MYAKFANIRFGFGDRLFILPDLWHHFWPLPAAPHSPTSGVEVATALLMATRAPLAMALGACIQVMTALCSAPIQPLLGCARNVTVLSLMRQEHR